MGNFGGPGIEGVGQADHADTEHDDGAASDAVGQHAEGPDQQKAHDLGDPGQPAADITGLISADDSQMLEENVGLGEVHVRHHPDADQGRVHVGPEVHGPHARRELYAAQAPAGALLNDVHQWPPGDVAAIISHRWERGHPALVEGGDALVPGGCLQKGAPWSSLRVGKPARQSPAVSGFPVRREESPGSGGRDAR